MFEQRVANLESVCLFLRAGNNGSDIRLLFGNGGGRLGIVGFVCGGGFLGGECLLTLMMGGG